MVMVFSNILSSALTMLPTGPKALAMPRMLSTSDLVTVLVTMATGIMMRRKAATPIMSRIQLEKLSWATIMYVRAAVIADESRIFAVDFQSTVTP